MDRPSGIIAPENYPEPLRNRPELVGLFVGGCVERGVGSSFRATAHAHTHGEFIGWICVRGWRRLANKSLMLHELAHIITRQGHTDSWRRCLRDLGGRVPARYQKRKTRARTQCACGAHRFGNAGATWYAKDNMWHSWANCRAAISIHRVAAAR